MGYPGDQQQPGGWGASQPPQEPYAPAHEPYEPYSAPTEQQYEPFAPQGEQSYSPSYGAEAPGGYDHDGPGGQDPFGPGNRDSGGGRKPWIIGGAIAAVVIVLGGGVAAFAMSGGDKKKDDTPPPAAAKSSSAAPSSKPSPSPTETGNGNKADTRSTDPKPLGLKEIFGKKTSFKYGGKKYVMTTRKATTKCADAVHGTKFRKALKKGGCTQVLRASFSDGKMVATIGVANLKSLDAAHAAQKASLPKDAFLVALPGAGSTKKLGQGLSVTSADPRFHFLIMSWVQYPNGKKIPKSAYSATSTFIRNVTKGTTLGTALAYRSISGEPYKG